MSSLTLRHSSVQPGSKLLIAWLLLCAAIALHVTDEALNNFLAVYNPTVLAVRQQVAWLPLPVFTFPVWIAGLALAIGLLVFLSIFISRGDRWIRPPAYLLTIMMMGNGLVHTLGTILGRTVPSVHFQRPMPGFWSSPLLIAASVYLLVQLRRGSRLDTPMGRD